MSFPIANIPTVNVDGRTGAGTALPSTGQVAAGNSANPSTFFGQHAGHQITMVGQFQSAKLGGIGKVIYCQTDNVLFVDSVE